MTNRIFLSAPDISGDELALVNEVFESNYVAPIGEMLNQFEAEMIEYTGIKHAVALTSGTAGLHLALHMLDLEPGEEVWTSSMTFIGGVSPIAYKNAVPVFFDLDPSSWTMSADLLEEALKEANQKNQLPRAIMTTDLYGQSCDLDRMLELGEQYDVPIVSDSAEALGAKYKGRHAGKGANSAVLSFNGNKIITSSGGGMLLSDDAALIDRARYLSTQARQLEVHYEHTEVGFNYRLSNVSAAIGLGQLRMIEDKVAKRRAIFDRYVDGFRSLEGIEFMPEPDEMRSTRWLTCLRFNEGTSKSSSEIQTVCANADIEVRPLWKPMHMQPVFKGTRFVGPGFCEELFESGLCLPSGSGMTLQEQKRVIAVFKSEFTADIG